MNKTINSYDKFLDLASKIGDKDIKNIRDLEMKYVESDPRVICWTEWFFNPQNDMSFRDMKNWIINTPEEEMMRLNIRKDRVLEFPDDPGCILDFFCERISPRGNYILNIENQVNYSPLIEFYNREQYYLDSIIAHEKGEVFKSKNYRNLLPVVGIWIYPLAPNKYLNSIYQTITDHRGASGNVKFLEEMPRLQNVKSLGIYLGNPDEINLDNFNLDQIDKERAALGLEFLDLLFTSYLSLDERIERLSQKFGLKPTEEFIEGAKTMEAMLEFAYNFARDERESLEIEKEERIAADKRAAEAEKSAEIQKEERIASDKRVDSLQVELEEARQNTKAANRRADREAEEKAALLKKCEALEKELEHYKK